MTTTSRVRIRTRRLGPAYRIRKDQRSNRERRPAAAAAGSVRILERKAGFLEIALVIDHRAVQILRAEFVDKQPHARALDDDVIGRWLLLDVQAVAETRTTAGQHGDPQPSRLRRGFLFGQEFLD